ncbi:sulfurtransferase TusA family protein [Galenea microaerophila]
MNEEILNVTNFPCPMPIIKLKQKMAQWQQIGVHGRIRLLVRDQGAIKDIPAFCQQQGLQLVSMDTEQEPMQFVIEI